MHYTWGGNDIADLNSLTGVSGNRRSSSHYLIGRQRDGHIWQLVTETLKAWHAPAVNSNSIGIEIVAKPGQEMTPKQNSAVVQLISYLLDKYGLDYRAITAHKWTPQATACPANLFGPGDIHKKITGLVKFKAWRKINFGKNFDIGIKRDKIVL